MPCPYVRNDHPIALFNSRHKRSGTTCGERRHSGETPADAGVQWLGEERFPGTLE